MKLLGIFLEIFLEDFFGGMFLEECFGRNFFGGFFREDFFGRNSLFALELICLSRFWFLSRFCLKAEEGRKISIFRSADARSSHLKI